MPDQVRHGGQSLGTFLNYDTASCAAMTGETLLPLILIEGFKMKPRWINFLAGFYFRFRTNNQ
jgi:hypothetical protein